MNKKGFIDDWLPLLPLGFTMLVLIFVAVSCDLIEQRTQAERFIYYDEYAEASFYTATLLQQPFPTDCSWLTVTAQDEPHRQAQQTLLQLLRYDPEATNADIALLFLQDKLSQKLSDKGVRQPLNNPSTAYFREAQPTTRYYADAFFSCLPFDASWNQLKQETFKNKKAEDIILKRTFTTSLTSLTYVTSLRIPSDNPTETNIYYTTEVALS